MAILIFDVDDTITPSTQQIPLEVAAELCLLNNKERIILISGSTCSQILKQIIEPFSMVYTMDRQLFKQYPIHILGTSGTRYELTLPPISRDSWNTLLVYKEEIHPSLRRSACHLFHEMRDKFNLHVNSDEEIQIQDRVTQITFSRFGREADPEVKRNWDPDTSKRQEYVRWLNDQVDRRGHYQDLYNNGFTFRIGGTTSIDAIPKRFNKKIGLERWLHHNNKWASTHDMYYFGDQLQEGGNDAPVTELLPEGHTFPVSGHRETLRLLREKVWKT